MANNDYINWFRASSPYINAYRGKTFVVYLPGEAIRHSNFHTIIQDLALLNSLGVRLVIVHGARPQIDEQISAAGIDPVLVERTRVTDAESLPHVLHAVGATRCVLESALSTGLPNSPMHGADISVLSGNFVVGMPKGVIDGVDFQFSGKVRKIADQNLVQALNNNAIVVISSLGYSLTGEIFNIPASEVASEVAIALGADKLITFIHSDGLLDADDNLVRQLRVSQCPNYFHANDKNDTSIISSLKSAYTVCNRGVPRAQLINFCQSGALLGELFTREGHGTLVHSDSYEEIRPATIDDVGGILGLIEPLEEQGILVRRSRELLEREINQFYILELDGTIIGCAGLYSFGDSDVGELACVATHPNHQGYGYAPKLLNKIEIEAKNLGFKKIFVLTTQTTHWFIEQGFKPADISDLPAQKQSAYNFQRLSKAFIKNL